jgi:thiamine-monophosphate kinase
VLGAVARPLLRSGARSGDALWVSGRLGGPGAALRAWNTGRQPARDARARFAHPEARFGLIGALRHATACIDVSDGLAADARHLAHASGVDIAIDLDAVPLFDGVSPAEAAMSGEEYELLATLPAGIVPVGFTRIGEVRAVGAAPAVIVTSAGQRVELPGGYDHFAE